MAAVLFGKNYLVCGDLPVDPEVRVVPGYGPFGLLAVEVVALVLEYGLFAQDAESMGQAARNEELEVVLFREHDRDMLSESRGERADVDRDVEHGALDHPYQLALGVDPLLEVEAPDDSVA